ncbi:MAG: hypothetical protein ABI855_03900, partial [Bacteroidota bacterium]
MNQLKKIWLPLFLLACICSCKTKIEEPKITAGSADLTKFLAVGGSYTAGYMDGALYLEGQQNSFPSILSKSFSDVSSQTFLQPLVNPGVGIGLDSNAKLILTNSTFCYGSSLSPEYASQTGDLSDYSWIGSQGPFSNLGLPGLRIFQINNQLFGNPQAGNPFYSRFVKMQDNDHTLLSDMTEFNPTFFSVWLGMDDILPYALNGGAPIKGTTPPKYDTIASPDYSATFGLYLEMMMKTLTSNKAKGAIGNIPSILDFPFFTAIPYNGVILSDSEATAINEKLSATYPDLQFYAGNNPFVIDDPGALRGKRFINSNEFILMSVPLEEIKCNHYGSYNLKDSSLHAIADQYVINGAEAALILQRIFDFNQKIKDVAVANDLAYVDM